MEVIRTDAFDRRLLEIRDSKARSRINVAVDRMQEGCFGDSKPVGHGVMEARIHYGPGYRIYYSRRGPVVVVLLICGDKRTQNEDIRRAIEMADDVPIFGIRP